MLNVPIIDAQHEKLVQLTNDLYLACLQNSETASIYFIEVVHKVVDYVRYHFTVEEKMMLLFEYPDYSSHKKEHENFVREILIETQKFSSKKHLVPNRYVQYLRDWILSHIAVCDKALADYILSVKDNHKIQRLFPKSASYKGI